jgi:hypothetical protein
MAKNCTNAVINNWKNNNEKMEWDLDAMIGTVTFATRRMMDLLDVPNDARSLTDMNETKLADNEHVPIAINCMDKALNNIRERHDRHNKRMRYCVEEIHTDLLTIFDNSVFILQVAMRTFKKQYFEEWGQAFGDYIAIIRAAAQYLHSMKSII